MGSIPDHFPVLQHEYMIRVHDGTDTLCDQNSRRTAEILLQGAAFAISGNLQKISNYIFLVTPTNVDISGDLQDLLSGSMETPSMRGRY